MIVAVFLKNIFKPQDREIKKLSSSENLTIADIKRQFKAEPIEEFHARINGNDAEDTLTVPVDCYVTVFPVIGKGGGGIKNIAGVVAGIALMVFTGGAGAGLLGMIGTSTGMLGLGMTMYFGGALLMGNQKTPSIDVPDYSGSAFEGGHSWNASTIKTKEGSAIPLTYGTVETSGQLIGQRVITEDLNGKSVQYLYLLLAAGEGKLDSITDLKINETAIDSIEGIKYETRLGDNEQAAVSDIVSHIKTQETYNLQINTDTWIVKTQPDIGKKVIISIAFPSGIYAVDTGSGAQVTAQTYLRAQYRLVGSTSESDWTDFFTSVIEKQSWVSRGMGGYYVTTETAVEYSGWKDKKTYACYADIDFTPPDESALYEFRFKDWCLEATGWAEKPSWYSVVQNLFSITISEETAQTYPNTALVMLGIPASTNLAGGLPKVSWKQARDYVLVWNSDLGSYQQKDAQNVAWMVYDLIHQCKGYSSSTEFVVYGEPVANMNYQAFSDWADFCSTIGDDGASTATGNLLVDSPSQMWTIIQKIAIAGRAYIIQQAGVFEPVWDCAKEISQIFTAGNMIAGSLGGEYISLKERATAIEASFINEETGDKETLYIQDERFNYAELDNPTQIFIPALTNKLVVAKFAKYMLRKNKYLKRTISFKADIDSIVSQVGDVIGVQSDICQWGVGGRILSASTTRVNLDTVVSLEVGKTYSLLIRYSDDTLVRRTIDTVTADGVTDILEFNTNPFSTTPERLSVYSFGIQNLEVKPFKILSISRDGDLQASIKAIEYLENIYVDDDDLIVIDYTAENTGVDVLNVTDALEEKNWTIPYTVEGFRGWQDGATVDLVWDVLPNDIFRYEIREGDTWESAELVTAGFSGSAWTARVSVEREYTFWIKSTSPLGLYSKDVATTTIDVKNTWTTNVVVSINEMDLKTGTHDHTVFSDVGKWVNFIGETWNTQGNLTFNAIKTEVLTMTGVSDE